MLRPKQSLKVKLTLSFVFLYLLSLTCTPLQKGLNLGGRPNPLLQLLKSVLFMSLLLESVDPGEVLSSGEAEANRKHKNM